MSSEGVNPHPLSEKNLFLLQEPAQPGLVSLGKEAEIKLFFLCYFSQREQSGNTASIYPSLNTSLVFSAIQYQSLGLKQFLSKDFTVPSTPMSTCPYEVLCVCIHAFFFFPVPCEVGRVNIWVSVSSLQGLGYFSRSRHNNSIKITVLQCVFASSSCHCLGNVTIW